MVDSLQKVLLQRCDKEGKTVQNLKFHLLFEVGSGESIICKVRTSFVQMVHMIQCAESWTLNLRLTEKNTGQFTISVFALIVNCSKLPLKPT